MRMDKMDAFVKAMYEAILSLDVEKIRSFAKKYNIPCHSNDMVLMARAAKAIRHISSATKEQKSKAKKWLLDNGDDMTMEKVTEEWIYYMINDCKIGGSLELALKELLKRRKEDNKHGVTYTLPCTKVEEKTVKEWIQKINEELDEFKAEIFDIFYDDEDIKQVCDNIDPGYGYDFSCVADEAMDTITAITSMLEYMGIDENARSKAQMRVNKRNAERGRL